MKNKHNKPEIVMKYDQGSYFPPMVSSMGYISIGLSVYAMTQGAFILSALLMLIGLFLSFARKKVIIHLENETYGKFISIFGILMGSYEKLPDYEQICLMRSIYSSNNYVGWVQFDSSISSQTDLVLLSDDHKKKLPLVTIHDETEAKEQLLKIANGLNLEVVTYDPPRSNRRRSQIR